MWAWEFLRRNRHYVRDFNSFVKKKDQGVHDKLAVSWGISRLANPDLSYSKLREEDDNIKSTFLFDGREPYVVFPYYSKDEVIDQAHPAGRRLPDPTELTMLLAPNQIAAIFNLDGNIQLQIDSLLAQLKQPKTSGQSSRDTRFAVFEVDASGNPPQGNNEIHLVGFEHEYVIRDFCLTKTTNAFLVSEKTLQQNDDFRSLIYRLLDYRIIHSAASALTHKSQPGTYQAFVIDIGCYAHLRKLDGRFNELDISASDAKDKLRSAPIISEAEFQASQLAAPSNVEDALMSESETLET